MPVLGRTNHAFLFDGVSDSIIVPQGVHTKLGDSTADGKTMSTLLSNNPSGSQSASLTSGMLSNQFSIEAWVMPDCGGTVAMMKDSFSLSVGNVDTPGPAVFSIVLDRGGQREVVTLSTAVAETNGYDGTVYPPPDFGGIHGTNNRFFSDSTTNRPTSLNINHRPLIHVVAALRQEDAVLFINGQLMARKILPSGEYSLHRSTDHLYIGGEGGQFRGIMEGLHISKRFSDSQINRNSPIADENTLLLYRFEEPISPISGTYKINTSFSTESSLSKIFFATASDAATLASALTGKTVTTGDVDFTASPYSSGNYKVFDAHTSPGSTSTRSVPHVPYNLLINAGAINPDTKKPNQKPPERVRLHAIKSINSSPYMVVSSVHLDFVNGTSDGLRTALHSRTADTDDFFTVITGDILIDGGTGAPYQPLHYATQLIDRTGQMVIDEGPFERHGIVYSSRMSTTDVDTDNPFAAVWDTTAVDEKFKIGHSGRHTLNHVDGHAFMRLLPEASEESIDQTIDAGSDIIDIYYDASPVGIEGQLPVNSIADVFTITGNYRVNDVVNSSSIKSESASIVNNGLPSGSRELIAIGGDDFNVLPFMLRGPTPNITGTLDSETRRYHLRPSRESRVALLHVPSLTSTSKALAPFVEIHYNAIDLTGASMGGTGNPYLMVEKTVPAGTTSVGGGSTVYDIIASDVASTSIDTPLYAPGGYVDIATVSKDVDSPIMKPNYLVGDTSEGYEADDEVDESYTPVNYTPRSSATAQPNTPPTAISASHVTSDQHESVFHKVIVNTTTNTKVKTLTDKTSYSRRDPSTVIGSPSNGQFDIGVTQSNSPMHEMFDVIDNYRIDGDINSNIRLILQPSKRSRTNQMRTLTSILDDIDEPNAITLFYLMSRARIRSVAQREIDGEMVTAVQCKSLSESALGRTVSKTGTGSPDSHIVKEIEPNAPVVTVTLGGPGQGASDIKQTFDPSPLSRLPFSTQRAYHVNAKDAAYNTSTKVGTLSVTPLNNNSTNMASWGTYGFAKKGRVYLENGASALYDSKNGTSFTFTDLYSKTGCNVAGSAVVSSIDAGTADLVVGMLVNGGGFTNARIQSIDSSSQVTIDTGTSVTDSNQTITFTHTVNSSSVSQRYLDPEGRNYDTFANWFKATGLAPGDTLGATATAVNGVICTEPDFGRQSLSDDGSTVNDRMFQAGGKDVNQDYQLGTQYASTRAIAEIPIFMNQVFDDEATGVFPGPDNSLRLSIDATYTAHTWNPTPVGRRPGSAFNSDRARHSAYSMAVSKKAERGRAFITKKIDTSGSNILKLYVSNISIFPPSSAITGNYGAADTYQGIANRPRFRRVFLESGAWALYTDTHTDGYLTIPDYEWAMTRQFREEMEVGAAVFLSGGLPSDTLIPIGDEPYTPSVAYENRSEHYHDTASVKTQGGNVDYGLRQYVSAVEFKAGPESNPHAARIIPKRASGEIASVSTTIVHTGSSDGQGIAIVSLTSKDDFDQFPDFAFDIATGLSTLAADLSSGDFIYEAEIDDSGTARKVHYYGRLKFSGATQEASSNSIALGFYNPDGTSAPSYLAAGKRITLTKRSRAILSEVAVTAMAAGSVVNNEFEAFTARVPEFIITSSTSTDVVTVENGTNDPTRLATSSTLDTINIRKGDKLYADDTFLKLVGTVESISLPTMGDTTNPTVTYTITLDNDALVTVTDKDLYISFENAFVEDPDAILNSTWVNPYASGGLRDGDTIWANMTLNNPHAMEGLFSKSRGVLNEAQVWKGFNGGVGEVNANPRDSIPLENFLIGETCLETAQNYAQHVNKTIEENYEALGLSASLAPTVAYVDPYLADDDHARVLLYDVGHDREFIAFQDIFMQVQTSAKAVEIGWPRKFIKDGTLIDLSEYVATNTAGGPSWATTQIDVANGFPSQNPYLRSTQQSKFIESAYAHDVANRIGSDVLTPFSGTLPTSIAASSTGATSPSIYGKAHGHHAHLGYSVSGGLADYALGDSAQMRTSDETVLPLFATVKHDFSRVRAFDDVFVSELKGLRKGTSNASLREPSTFHDTPDGTRVIPAFLALKGIRSTELDLSSHEESASALNGRIQHLPHWKKMEFVRRLDIDVGSLSLAENVTDIETAAHELVRVINQAAAKKASKVVDANTTGSAHDPAPWWDANSAFESSDRGSHMGYLRAHIGRQVQDLNGVPGYTVVIHSTVPGASGRNFCVWLDNSKGQSVYNPQFIVGHGGRWRNFWAQPEEIENENMHPAPLPLNKHGRPFAPITTLTQYVDSESTGAASVPPLDFASRDNNTDSPVLRAISNAVGGSGYNSVGLDSFDSKSSDKVLVEGLRVGSQAVGRINFGGLVKAGVPGWSPVAGVWGMGESGDDTFAKRYGNNTLTSYGDYVPASDVKSTKIGKAPLYGVKLTDHRGVNHGVRFIYRQIDTPFSNDNTQLPNTIENEVCVFFNDRTNSQGGFTLGNHMVGSGDATGRMSGLSGTDKNYYGGKWEPVPARNMAIECSYGYNHSSKTLKVVFVDPYDTSATGTLTHPDLLGYLGFPKENGRIQLTQNSGSGSQGITLSYTSRSQNNTDGEHRFEGIVSELSATTTSNVNDILISPVLNWTTLVTDELLAAVTAAAINATSTGSFIRSGINSEQGVTFDCRDMYAADGRTFREHGIQEDSIIIRAYNPSNPVKPISNFFSATLHRDFGIKAAHIEYGEIQKSEKGSDGGWSFGTSRANTDSDIDAGRDIDCGYVPFTILQITSNSKGPNSNTRTPLLVDSFNEEVREELLSKWTSNLRGGNYTRQSGDHILPCVSNPMLRYTSVDTSDNEIFISTNSAEDELWGFLAPANVGNGTVPSFGERRRIYLFPEASAVVEGHSGNDSSTTKNLRTLIWDNDTATSEWVTAFANDGGNSDSYDTAVISLFGDLERSREFCGLRSLGSVDSSPIHYFRGGRSSIDNNVPVFFGGGFSGVVLDVNDGSMNDYSDFYTHPYSSGPTGVCGIQNANEILTSHAVLDANAMLAFFPGTPFLNQHRGSIMPPAHNRDNMLSPDLDSGSGTINSSHPNSAPYTAGVIVQKPSPLVLRFAHPTARYEDHKDSTVDNKTTYIVFGPGQAFPFTQEVADSSGMTGANSDHPHTGAVLTVGNTWSKIPNFAGAKGGLPNPIVNQDGNYMPEDAAYHNAYHAFHWRTPLNWEPPMGKPVSAYAKLKQRPEHGRLYGQYFNDNSINPSAGAHGVDATNDLLSLRGMPLRHNPLIGFGIAMGADMVWHMDGGYHPGGHWMDNQIAVNPSHPDGDTTLSVWGPTTQIHPTAFRVSGVITTKVLAYAASEGDLVAGDVDMEYIIVDATRCQNGEELATVVGAAINEFPGKGALKAMGGTHMPSMGNAMRQDRYGWVELDTYVAYVTTTPFYVDFRSTTHTSQSLLEQIPACGWLKSLDGAGTNAGWACYHSREVHYTSSQWRVRFYLAPNRVTGEFKFEDYNTLNDGSTTVSSISGTKLYVWSKAGVHRFNNVASTTRDHMCQVHFSGLVDAVDRTRPIGAVGWNGERYSRLNSIEVESGKYGSGLGAWHSELGFSPYGSSASFMSGLGTIPVVAPLTRSPESAPPVDGLGQGTANLMRYLSDPYVYHSDDFNVEKLICNTNHTSGLSDGSSTSVRHIQMASGNTNSLLVGMPVSGTGIPAGATITAINNTTFFTISADTTATNSSVTLSVSLPYSRSDTDDNAPHTLHAPPSHYDIAATFPDELVRPQGLFSRAFLVVSSESEFALIAKKDRDTSTCVGDFLIAKSRSSLRYAGTTQWDERYHSQDRFVATANAGPNVEALIVDDTAMPTDSTDTAAYTYHTGSVTDLRLENATPDRAKTGDLVTDLDFSLGSKNLESGISAERNVVPEYFDVDGHTSDSDFPDEFWMGDVLAHDLYKRSSALNFSTEHIVWKRMDGGNLSLPALNARGLGAVPWTTRVASSTAHTSGEKLYGNVRFSFETTNSALLPVIQAQEISHPQLADRNPVEIGGVLTIPNEEMQFDEVTVIDDTGQEHTIQGGSPLGTVIRSFNVQVPSRDKRGPSLANSGDTPTMMVQLPDPDTIPGNIVVRSGFDPVQAYQTESFGSGGMLHADLSETHTGHLFDSSVSTPRKSPTYEDHNWEHINMETNLSKTTGWKEATGSNPLKLSYELHDRTLFFHVTKMGHSHTHRYPTTYTHANGVENQALNVSSWNSSTSVLTVDATINTRIYDASFGTKEVKDSRRFIRIFNPTTEESVVASYTGISGATFTGVVGDVDFTDFIAAQTVANLDVVPSYYVPAGSARFFAARRLRDHAEVSGSSPDMAHTLYMDGDANTLAHTRYTKPQLTPMPFPRMGHHYATATMPILPGHLAHPAYQSLYSGHLAERASNAGFRDSQTVSGFRDRELFNDEKTTTSVSSAMTTAVTDYMSPSEPELFFSGVSAPIGPSDIHGGAFTLMFETKVKWDGYGILASRGSVAGVVNKAGGHSIVLEASTKYTQTPHFPDPKEVGAYQIVIQPNLFNGQLVGYHYYSSTQKLTSQQVNTVIGMDIITDAGGVVLYLAEATGADVRGCEVFINEVILDQDADFAGQLSNIPPLSVYNPFGVELTESPSFTRRAFPYTPMMSKATPGYTINIPWWSILHKIGPNDGSSAGFIHISQYTPCNYYEFSRSTLGSIGNQLTIAGYPSIYPDIYSSILQNTSLSPVCIVKNVSGTTSNYTLTVDDASMFPEKPLYSEKLEFTDANGERHTASYTSRSGLTVGTVNVPNTFNTVATTGGAITAGMEIRLTRAYDNLPAKDIFTDVNRSIFTKILPQLKNGTRDTSSLHIPDAFLCMWHPNLGRPYTFYSDSSRTWGGTTTDRAVDAAPYNSMPEHFQSIHYQDVVYSMSHGPFDLRIKTPDVDKDGSVTAADSDHNQAGVNQASTNIMLNRFWPCGSRGGPHSSRPDAFVQAAASWIVPRAYSSDDLYRLHDSDAIDASYARTAGITKTKIATNDAYRLPYGYRIAVRQACNRPRWGLIPTRAILEDALSGVSATTVGYRAGPLVQLETRTWTYAGGDSTQPQTPTFPNTYVGVMERLTNFSAMLGMDKHEFQVRHSEGRRMTRPFGAPVRTLRNNNKVQRDWWGDTEGKAVTRLVEAAQYYLVDWWGNTRGEDVRRAPVRGFGIRPAWDCGDAYEYDRTNGRTPYRRIWNNGRPIFNLKNVASLSTGNISVTTNFTIPRFGGTDNDINLSGSDNDLVDVFAPTHALRVGDMGNGRGVRYPTMFNEDVLTALSAPVHTTGIVLSHNTSEPLFGDGLLRPRNDVLQADEVKRGISARLEIAEDGLLKPEAVVSDRVEQVVGDSPHKDAISRTSPRIGIDARTSEDVEKPHVVINTEAHSLHTDRNLGQRTVLQGAHMPGVQTLVDANYNAIDFNATNGTTNSVLKFSHTSNMRPMGGDYILEARSFGGLFDDTGWGVGSLTGSNKTSNPYQHATTYNTDSVRNNESDRSVKFLIRPVRVLDRYHVEMYRPKTAAIAQSDGDYFQATAGGKYGIFTYETTGGRSPTANTPDNRASPDSNGPYIPIVYMNTSSGGSADQTPTSHGPNLKGAGVSGYSTDTLASLVCRLIVSENTLQHHRSDAPRRRVTSEDLSTTRRKDFSIKPRFSQSLHPKGHKGDVTFGTSDHSGDAS